MNVLPDDLIAQARDGGHIGMRAGARLMTLLENDPEKQAEFLRKTGFPSGPRLVLGITGAPGCGKSTLVDALLAAFRSLHPDARIGVIAIDPSSPFTGGAILADRVRMMRHAEDPAIFVRSMASRGHLGGLALGVGGVLSVMAWMGFDIVLIETVGVGQSEVDIVRTADEVAVVLAPGNGDSLQLLKAGLMEIGGLIVVNKADKDGAEALRDGVLAMLELADTTRHREVLLVSATENRGVTELASRFESLGSANSHRRSAETRREKARQLLLQLATRRLEHSLENHPRIREELARRIEDPSGSWTGLVQDLLAAAATADSIQPSPRKPSHV
jgi:LAO/AO transport system ATPase